MAPRGGSEGARAALVTGASSGIGRALAADLLASGYGVSAVARDPARAGLEGAYEIAADLRGEDACCEAVRAHRERFGRLDVLVCCAGVGVSQPVSEISAKALDLQLDVNLRGLVLVVREALPLLLEARGLVVALASVLGLRGDASLPVYAATKHAVVGFTRSLAEEVTARGVRVTAICPAFVATPMTSWVQGRIPPEEMIAPEDVVRALRFLLELRPPCHVPELAIERVGAGSGP
jgi:NAD(P)-dependent dehydrogenase (short-subunit alcohol dehydrogenase family)